MKLFEFSIGEEIILIVEKKHSTHRFSTQIIDVIDEKVYLGQIIVNDHPVHFRNKSDTKLSITINAGTKAYTFNNIILNEINKTLGKNYKNALCVSCEEDVEPINRRSFYRVYMGVDGKLQYGQNQRTFEVLVRDISANGIGVISSKENRLHIGTEVCITFVDEMADEEFSILCTVVRKVELNENEVIYGCQFPEIDSDMEHFVALKQRLLYKVD